VTDIPPISFRRLGLAAAMLLVAAPPTFLAVIVAYRLGGMALAVTTCAMITAVVYTGMDAIRDGVKPDRAWIMRKTTSNLIYVSVLIVIATIAFGIGPD